MLDRRRPRPHVGEGDRELGHVGEDDACPNCPHWDDVDANGPLPLHATLLLHYTHYPSAVVTALQLPPPAPPGATITPTPTPRPAPTLSATPLPTLRPPMIVLPLGTPTPTPTPSPLGPLATAVPRVEDAEWPAPMSRAGIHTGSGRSRHPTGAASASRVVFCGLMSPPPAPSEDRDLPAFHRQATSIPTITPSPLLATVAPNPRIMIVRTPRPTPSATPIPTKNCGDDYDCATENIDRPPLPPGTPPPPPPPLLPFFAAQHHSYPNTSRPYPRVFLTLTTPSPQAPPPPPPPRQRLHLRLRPRRHRYSNATSASTWHSFWTRVHATGAQ